MRQMSKIEVTLVTGRTIDQGTSKEHGKLSREYREYVAICELDPDDLKDLNLKEDSNVIVSTEHGEVVVKAKTSKRAPHRRVAYMPYGLWANLVMASDTDGTGMPSFKGVRAEIEPAPTDEVQTVEQLLNRFFRKRLP